MWPLGPSWYSLDPLLQRADPAWPQLSEGLRKLHITPSCCAAQHVRKESSACKVWLRHTLA